MYIGILYDILIRNNAYNDTAMARINTRVPPRVDNPNTRDMPRHGTTSLAIE